MRAVFLQVIGWLDRFLGLVVESFIASNFRDEGGLHEWR